MNATKKFELWQVTPVRKLNEDSELVKNDVTGMLMVRRFLMPENLAVMQKLTLIRQKNLMEVYDCALIDGRCVCLCEYIEGETLEQRVGRCGVFNEEQTKMIISSLCDALDALHGAGIIHRDVTPTNVMIDRDNTVKLIDYDISRSVRESASADTRILGTVGYASPEQFGFSQTGVRADIYACGALMNYLLTGELPNEKRYNGALGKVIGWCTEIDEEKRYASAAELKQAITGKKYRSPEQLHQRFRPLPGFRSKRILPKIVTAVLIALWAMLTVVFFQNIAKCFDKANRSGWTEYRLRELRENCLIALVFLVLLTLIPYLCFGDVGRLSRRLSPKDYTRGERIMRLIGWLSIAAGIAVMLFVKL